MAALLLWLADMALAHGGPSKVVGRFVVSLVLVPEGEATRLRFVFQDWRTGADLAVPISLRVTIRNEAIRETTFTSPAIQTTTGAGELLHRFAQDGSYEVFVEFETADEPGRTYRPEDWLVWISRAGIFAGSGWWVLGLSGLTAAGATLWWTHARARAIPVPPSPEDQS